MADHPAWKPPPCTWDRCDQRAVARVACPPSIQGSGLAIVRPITSPVSTGHPLCADHAHHQVDLLLMRAMPRPAA